MKAVALFSNLHNIGFHQIHYRLLETYSVHPKTCFDGLCFGATID